MSDDSSRTYRSGESFEITTEYTSEWPQPVGHTEQSTGGYPKRDVEFTTSVANVSAAWGEVEPEDGADA